MKKIYFILIGFTVLAVSNRGIAQHKVSLSVYGSPQFGLLHNNDDNDNSSFDHRVRFNTAFGVGGAYSFTENTGIGLDVLYSLQGQRFDINGKDSIQRQNYVKIPLYFLFVSSASSPISFIGKIGPQLSILTSSKRGANNSSSDKDTKDWYKSATFGGMAGAGAQFRFNTNLFLTTLARFDYDFTNAEDDGNAHWRAGRANTYNTTFGLEIGLKFRLH
jgi:hypothetical protein